MSYWMIAVPNEKSATADNTFRTLDERTKQYSKNYQFRIPILKVGTLDTLMALSDDLQKYDVMVGGIAKKIEKTYLEVYKNEPQADAKTAETPELRVGQQTPKDYVEKFKWNDKRYRDPATLRNISDSIVKEAIKADESLKKQQSEYNEVRAAVTALERKDTGSLLVRSLAPYVKEKDIIEKEFLTTLLVVVPKAKDLEWQHEYEILEDIQEKREAEEKKRKDEEAAIRAEKDRQAALEAANKENKSTHGTVAKKPTDLKKTNSTSTTVKKTPSSASINSTEPATPSATSSISTDEKEAAAPTTTPASKVNTKKKAEKEEKKTTRLKQCKSVVPSSAKRLTEDDEYVLYRLVVLKNGVDHYKNLLRERRYTVRPFKYDPDEEKKSKEEKNMLIKKKTALWNYLIRWCTTTYAEIFASWIHIKAIRLYVEAVLRYGLPVNLCFALLEPRKGYEKHVRDTLQQLYAKLASANLTQALDANETDLSGFGSDFYPYVYLPLTLYD